MHFSLLVDYDIGLFRRTPREMYCICSDTHDRGGEPKADFPKMPSTFRNVLAQWSVIAAAPHISSKHPDHTLSALLTHIFAHRRESLRTPYKYIMLVALWPHFHSSFPLCLRSSLWSSATYLLLPFCDYVLVCDDARIRSRWRKNLCACVCVFVCIKQQ